MNHSQGSAGPQTRTNIDRERSRLIRAAVRLVKETTGRPYTQAAFLREAIDAQLRAVARDYNDGRPLSPDDEPLPRGRV